MRYLLLIVHLNLPVEHPHSVFAKFYADLGACQRVAAAQAQKPQRFARCYELVEPGSEI